MKEEKINLNRSTVEEGKERLVLLFFVETERKGTKSRN